MFLKRLEILARDAVWEEEITPDPTGIILSDSETDDGAAVGDLVGVMFMVGGVAPATFTLTSNPDDLWQIDGDRLEVAASLAGKGGTQESPMVKVTDALGQVFEAVLPITIAETEGGNDSGIGEDDVDVIVPDPEDPESDGGGFVNTPIVQDTSEGLKIAGKNGGSATFLLDWGVPVAGATVTMKYDPDWSGMNKQGREAAVGFAFKSGNSFHLASLRGDGANPASLRKSKVYGDFRKSNQFTLTNDGAASHGTKDGPNWLQIEFAGDGSTYTLRSSADGDTWTDEYTAAVPTPLAEATDATQFGPGAYFSNSDKGVFSIVIEQFDTEGFVTVPAQFGTGDWSVADAATGGDITITITALPSDGGSAITDLEYQIDGGSWVSMSGTATGDYPVSGLNVGQEYDVAIRAVNANGAGTASAMKAVTPSGADAGILAAVYFTVSGTTPTIVGQKNVASVTRQATGIYRITYSSALANNNYCVIAGGRFVDAAVDGAVLVQPNRNSTGGNNTYSTTTLDIAVQGSDSRTNAFDPEKCGVVIFDQQAVSSVNYLAAASWTVSGTTVTVQRQKNVASMSRHAEGVYRVNFNSALADADYSEFVMSRYPDFTNVSSPIAGQNRNTTIPSNLHSTTALDLCTGRINNSASPGIFEAARGSVLIGKSNVAPMGTVARARFSVSGTTVTIVNSHNVASVTRQAKGCYRVTFSEAAEDTDYVVFVSGKWANDTAHDAPIIGANRNNSASRNTYSTAAVDIVCETFATLEDDPEVVNVWVVKPWLM